MSEQDDYTEIREHTSNDPYCRCVGTDLAEVGGEYTETTLTVTENHLNFHGTPHGDAVYSFADAVSAAVSNSHGGAIFALETNISYLAAVEVGETLHAVARETHLGRRAAEYEIVVSGGDGKRVATFRGRVYKPDGR